MTTVYRSYNLIFISARYSKGNGKLSMKNGICIYGNRFVKNLSKIIVQNSVK